MKNMQKYWYVLGLFLVVGMVNAQNKIDLTGKLGAMVYNLPSGENGIKNMAFNGDYRILGYAGLRVGIKISPNNKPQSYVYKGSVYYASQIPEISAIQITKVSGTLTVGNNSLKAGDKHHKIEVYIGRGLDHTGVQAGNNFLVAEVVPDGFENNNTYVNFTPSSISYDATDVHSAIEKWLAKEKDKKKKEENEARYNELISSAFRSTFGANPNYADALAKYRQASMLDVEDKSAALAGIEEMKEKIEAEKEKDKKKSTDKPAETKTAAKPKKTEDWQIKMCLEEKRKLEKLVIRARQENSLDAWQDADNQLKSMGRICFAYTGFEDEIDRSLKAATLVASAKAISTLVVATPWNYGYGQFFGADNGANLHRFQFGTSGGSFENQRVNVSFSLLTQFMKFPTMTVNYRFEGDNGEEINNLRPREKDDYRSFGFAMGPSLNIWPHKNIFVRLIPEMQLGIATKTFSGFNYSPAMNGILGVRLGKVYLSGNYGLIWSKIGAKGFDEEKGSITYGGTTTEVKGTWYPENVNDKKMISNKYWVISLGLQLGD